jgi:hypothetical protein
MTLPDPAWRQADDPPELPDVCEDCGGSGWLDPDTACWCNPDELAAPVAAIVCYDGF